MIKNNSLPVTDCRGNVISVEKPPVRIISLVPSLTEMLFDLDVGQFVIGGTRYCIYPSKKHDDFTIVGGTKKVNFNLIESLKPDLIVANKEENTREIIERLDKICPVYVSYLTKVTDHFKLFQDIGLLFDLQKRTSQLSARLSHDLTSFTADDTCQVSFVYVIWKNPVMVAGGDTYISDFLELFGLTNSFAPNEFRYPETSAEAINILKPDVVFLSSEPFPFTENDIPEWSVIFPDSQVIFIDGSMTSWYGTRIFNSLKYFKNQIIPQIKL